MTQLLVQAAFGLPKRVGAMGAVAAPSRRSPLAGCRILVVEDEMLIMMDAEDMLHDLGCETVVTAATVDKALGFIGSEVIDAALLDMNLNGDRSYAVADALAVRGIPFAFATGYGLNGLREGDGDTPMLVKPYGINDLSKTLTALLGGAPQPS